MRENNLPARKIQKYYKAIAKDLETQYPFARNIRTDGKEIWYEKLDELIRADGKKQFDMEKIIGSFLKRI
ncbi:MAG TPA: hypothetical protein VFM99_08315 [Chitinophagales bacterium]|nr:hypothetical protein [Chitinophagales bacterium]